MKTGPKGYPYHILIETYRSWGHDPGLEACLCGRRPGGFERFVRLVLRARKLEVCFLSGEYEPGLRVGEAALEEAKSAGLALGQAQTLMSLAKIHAGHSEFQAMRETSERALELFTALGNLPGRAIILNQLGYLYDCCLGQFEKARRYYEQALELNEILGNKQSMAICLDNLAMVHINNGDYEQAQRNLERSLQVLEELGDLYSQGYCLAMTGVLHSRRGDLASAIRFQEQALSLYETVGDRSGQAYALTNLGRFESSLGNYPKALSSYERALGLFAAIGDLSGSAYVLMNRGTAHEALGDFARAVACQEQALSIQRRTGEQLNRAQSLALLVISYLGLDEGKKAEEALNEAQAMVRESDPGSNVLCSLALSAAALALETKDLDVAGQEIESGLLLAEALSSKHHRALLLSLRARLKDKQGDWPGSERDYTESVNLFGSLGDKVELAKVSCYFGKALLAHEEEEKGRWYLAEARRLWEAIGAKGRLARMDNETDGKA